MITYLKDTNMFDFAENTNVMFTIPVNTVGVMGKGLALEAREMFPDLNLQYQALCREGNCNVGQINIVESNGLMFILFPTKKHFKDASQLEYIQNGMHHLAYVFINDIYDHQILIPKLGCGLG